MATENKVENTVTESPATDQKMINVPKLYFRNMNMKKVEQKLVAGAESFQRWVIPVNTPFFTRGYARGGVVKTGGTDKAPKYILRLCHVEAPEGRTDFTTGASTISDTLTKYDDVCREAVDFLINSFGLQLPPWLTKGPFIFKSGIESAHVVYNDAEVPTSVSTAFFLHPEWTACKVFNTQTGKLYDRDINEFIYRKDRYGSGSGNSLFEITSKIKMFDFVLNRQTGIVEVNAYVNVTKCVLFMGKQDRTPLKEDFDFKSEKNKEEDDRLTDQLMIEDPTEDFYATHGLLDGGEYVLPASFSTPLLKFKRKTMESNFVNKDGL